MKRNLRGVGDVAEEDVFQRRVGRFQDLGQEGGAERAAFVLDVGVVRAGEVDALEGAGTR